MAPRATVYGYNLRVDHTDINTGDALTRNRGITAVSNSSWGKAGSPGLFTAPQIFTLAFDLGINNGYGGKGTFYVISAGNGHRIGSHANLSELITHRGVTAVCAVNDSDVRASYSEVGANLWICAPSGEATLSEYREIITTENYDRYNYLADGTSMSAPIVSGVAALMRDANPELTWRDLKLILAASARMNDPANAGWLTGAPKYRAEQNTDTYHFNHRYGFGVVDAQAAVTLAKNWQTLPPMLTSTVESGSLNGRVPDAPLTGTPSTVYHQLTLDTDVEFTEFVEVNVTFNHPSFRDLSIALVSPSGAVSVLALPWDTFTPDDPDDIDFYPLVGSFRLGSARHLGEDPNGIWTLHVTDNFHGGEGVLASWNLTVYGHTQPAPAPQVEVSFAESAYTVTEGGSVTVAISLNADPQRTVAVPITVTNLHGAVAADYSGIPESVTFVSGGPTQQLVTITATDDRIADANESVKLGFGALPERVSTGATAETTILIADNDIAGVTVQPTSLTVLEGATQTYTVKLNTQPSETVTVMASTDNTDVTTTPKALIFNSAIWNTAQTVTVTAAQDDDAQDDSATVTHTVSGYGAVTTAASVTVTVTDDEPPVEVSFAESAYSVTEGDSVDVVVSLSADPQRTVVVPILVTNQGGATDDDYSGIPENVTFISGGPIQQTFSITATDDQIVDTNESLVLGFGVLPIKVTAGTTTAETVVSITDNDAAGMPTVQMTLTETPLVRLRVGIPVTVRFDQTVSGFGIDDVAVTNGRPENLTGESGGTDYSFDLVPTAISVVTVDVAAGAAQNAQGQDSLAAPQLRVGLPYDDDHDGRINRAEVITAIGDYLFGGQLTRDEVIAIIGLYLFG